MHAAYVMWGLLWDPRALNDSREDSVLQTAVKELKNPRRSVISGILSLFAEFLGILSQAHCLNDTE
jgi:hypothetical protein